MKSRRKNQRQSKTELKKRGNRVSGKTGLPPGSLVHIGKIRTETVTIRMTEYHDGFIEANVIKDIERLSITDDTVNRWIEIRGLQDTEIIESIGKKLKISPLFLEDIVNTEHRPKFEVEDEMIFFTMKAYSLSETKEMQSEQASFILGKGFLISFMETDRDWFRPVRDLLTDKIGKIRQRNLDFLLYSLLDVIVDQYYEVIEEIGDQLEDLEDMIFEKPSRELIEKNRLIKKDIIALRKALLPALEAANKLKRDEPELIHKDIMRYYDDIHDHMIQIMDYIDSYRELSSELKESYLSNITLRMNQVMKLLTIITTIFIPLSFIAGIYGMNFEYMPELAWKNGYFFVLGFMFLIMAVMLIYFRRKKWM